MNENEIGSLIINAAFEVHKNLGAGLFESTYETCLCHELQLRNLGTKRQVGLPVIYKEVGMDCGYRIDMIVEDKVIVEIKSVESLNDIHLAQLLTYLKLSNRTLGYLINFNVKQLKDGIKRVILSSV